MLKNVLYKAVLFTGVCLMCVACSQEDDVASQTGGGDGVTILVRIADASATRATEDGWDEGWNENTIERLDIFRFAANGEPKGHLLPSNLPSFTSQNTVFQEVTVNDLTYSELADNTGDVFYMVANCPQLEGETIENLDGLKALTATPTLKLDEKQGAFAMDGKGVLALNAGNKTATLSFELSRAAVKIRVAVTDNNGSSIIDQCSYLLNNYVLTPTSALSEGELYGKGTNQRLESMAEFGKANLTNGGKAVFYSYPNDWFDESLLAADGTFADPVIYTKDDLIDEEKQTYIMLKAPYTDGNTYYYKVPVNFTMADNSDKDGFTAAEIETLRNGYYRINRNCLYDITVTIDRVGGPLTEPVTPRFHIRVNDWQKGGDYKIGQGEFE